MRKQLFALTAFLLALSSSLMAKEHKDSGTGQPCTTQQDQSARTKSKSHKQKDNAKKQKHQKSPQENYDPLAGMFG
jgi:uncharacterized protein YxeA